VEEAAVGSGKSTMVAATVKGGAVEVGKGEGTGWVEAAVVSLKVVVEATRGAGLGIVSSLTAAVVETAWVVAVVSLSSARASV
jgi:hypothetical protein